MTVSVAIDLALDRLFTYTVPAALQEKLAVGQLLSVPFGYREARGFAMEVRSAREEGGSAGYRLKPIAAIVDETPFFTPALLELVKKVAAYTASPVETVLRTALPAAVLKKNMRPRELLFVEPVGSSWSSELELESGGALLVGDETLDARRETQGESQSRLTSSVSRPLPPPAPGTPHQAPGTRHQAPGTPLPAPGTKHQALSTPRQQWLFEQIVRLGGGWMTQLCHELKTTPASLRQLAQRGLVTIVPRAKRRDPLGSRRILPSKPLPLNAEQRAALDVLTSAQRPSLLFGVTGSGKTEVYLQAIAKELDAGRGAIVMVPEIALTPQTVNRFASRFGDRVAVLHSALSDGERYDEWHRIRSGEARVVVGPRSAVWAPVRRLGLIVVDEEHETSYKQDETPRYHARDVAVLRGAVEGVRVVLGSATPSLESWMNVKRGKYELATMRQRAGAGRLPVVRTVEMSGGEIFSRELLEAIGLRLDRHEQTILFLNRRGYSRSVTCGSCGHVIACPDCGLPYTYHRADSCLRCHVCGGWIPVPTACPKCNCPGFDFTGIGTQRAEAALAKCFKRARILRMDADSTSRKQSHDDILSAFRRGEADVLLGTQMIAKGLDFPNVTLVGVLNADSSLNMPDFRAGERTYQLLAQVAGRAGRAELPGEVILQSHDASAPILQAVMRGDYEGFTAEELKARAECFLPPYCHFAVALFSSRDLRQVGDWATMYAKSLTAYAAKSGGLRVSEAMPCALEKADGRYRWQIVLRAERAAEIVRAWRWIVAARPAPGTLRVSVDIDAVNG